MGNAQDLFNAACVPYDHAQELVKNVAEDFRQLEKNATGDSKFNPMITMIEFDQILQGVLLTQALADGNFDRLERQFIDKITDHGDLLDHIKHETNGKISLTWDQIAWMDGRTQAELIEVLPAIMERRCKDFLVPFLLLQRIVDDVDFMNLLVKDIATIGAMLAGVDGKVDDIEAEGAMAMLTELLLKPWNEMSQQIN